MKKSLIYFDDAERDLNLNMYVADTQGFERLADDTWLNTKLFFENLIKIL